MKIVTALLQFFADDALTVGLVIAWIVVFWAASRAAHSASFLAVLFLAGIVGVLTVSIIQGPARNRSIVGYARIVSAASNPGGT